MKTGANRDADGTIDRSPPPTEEVKDLWVFLDGSDIHVGCGVMPEGYVRPDEDFLLTVKLAEAGVFEDIGTRRGPLARPKSPPPMLVPEDDILMDDRLHLSTLRALRESVQRRETAMSLRQERPDLYSPELL